MTGSQRSEPVEPANAPAASAVHRNRTLRAFLANMRQELSTPVYAIVDYGGMLLEDARELGLVEAVPDLEKMNAAGKRLLNLMNCILDPGQGQPKDSSTELNSFTSHIRHELRTPLNAILGYSEMLLEDMQGEGAPGEFASTLQKVNSSGKHVLELLDDIVRLARPDNVRDDANPEMAKSLAMVQDVVASIRPLKENDLDVYQAGGGSVLVVDDNEINLDLLRRHLVRQGFTVTTTTNGCQAMELLRAQGFDVILLDIVMPQMNGYEVLQRIKADEQLRHIPVIMVSALNEMDSLVRCIALGAADYLPKPFDPLLLRARINSSLTGKRLRDMEQAYLKQLQAEQEKSERLLLNILPGPVAQRLKRGESLLADDLPDVTVLFADLVGFTSYASRHTTASVLQMLNRFFSAFDELADRYGLEKIKTIGDAYMLAGGVPAPRQDHASAVADMALDMQASMTKVNAECGESMQLRVGIHSGQVSAGVIGIKKFAYDLWGDTVNIAKRMEECSSAGAILVSPVTRERLAGGYVFHERGLTMVKGKGEMMTYVLVGRKEHQGTLQP